MRAQEQLAPVSVVIPCFRCGPTIGRALASVLQQSRKPAEVILVDDASGDDTWAVLSDLARAHPGWVRLLKLESNRGAASARNAGWAVARQPYIAFLDADDAWHPSKIEIQSDFMAHHPDVVLCGHRHRVLTRADAQPDWTLEQGPQQLIHKWQLLLENRFVTPSVMLKAGIGQRFAEGRRHMEDRLLWLEIICDGAVVVCLDLELAATYKLPYGVAGLSSNLWQMARFDIDNYRVLHGTGRLSLLSAGALMVFSLLKFVRRLARVMIWRMARKG